MTRRRFVQLSGLTVAAAAGGAVCAAPAVGRYAGILSDHFDGRHFRNSTGAPAGKSFADVLRWQWQSKAEKWPARIDDGLTPRLPGQVGPGELAATFVGHATFLVQNPGGLNVLTDPVWSERASPFSAIGPRRVRRPALELASLPPIHVVFVSHNHYDHLDVPTLQRLEAAHRPLFLTPLGNASFLRGHGLSQVVELDWWQAHELEKPVRAKLTLTPAQHWSRRWLGDTNRALWGGLRVETDRGPSWHFTGDSGYHPTLFTGIRQRLGAPDLALVPIGAYAPRWFMGAQHMDPQDAVKAHRDLGSRQSLAMHFGTFRLTDEAVDAPGRELVAALDAAGLGRAEFRVPRFGETLLTPR